MPATPQMKQAPMRICSLLPSATEILYALGLGDSVVGVTHECDFPVGASKKPALIRPRVDPQSPAAEIDRQVTELVSLGESIYGVDAELLASLSPDLIVTQDLCHVCAASPDDLATALARFAKPPRILTLAPHSLADVWDDIRRVGDATGRRQEGEALATALDRRVARIGEKSASAASRPRVICLEWLDPFYVAGHWVPEMIAKAGGEDALGRPGEISVRASSEAIARSLADVMIVMPCGYNVNRTVAEFRVEGLPEEWSHLPAVRERRIYALDANSYSSRPGPRLADGVEIIAGILHPELFPRKSSPDVCRKL
jgi:iron complex transport system substrate-binding protein